MAKSDRMKIAGGRECPKCRRPMQRYQHTAAFKPKAGRGHYRLWDYCRPCNHMQYYPGTFVPSESDAPEAPFEPQQDGGIQMEQFRVNLDASGVNLQVLPWDWRAVSVKMAVDQARELGHALLEAANPKPRVKRRRLSEPGEAPF